MMTNSLPMQMAPDRRMCIGLTTLLAVRAELDAGQPGKYPAVRCCSHRVRLWLSHHVQHWPPGARAADDVSRLL